VLIPEDENFMILMIHCLRKDHYLFLRTMQGQLVARSGKIKYLSRTAYLCGNSACLEVNSEAVAYVRVRGLTDGEQQEKEECHLCGHQLKEQFSKRDISTKVGHAYSMENNYT
jgi:hypothetical protein